MDDTVVGIMVQPVIDFGVWVADTLVTTAQYALAGWIQHL